MRRNRRVATLALTTIVALFGLGACKRKTPPPSPAPTTTGPPIVLAPAPVPSGPLSPVEGLDLCAKTDLAPLADLKLRVEKTNPDTRGQGDAEVACFFSMRTAAGRHASLSVTVTTTKSVEEAKNVMRMSRNFRRNMGMNHEGSLSGIWQEADGFSQETEKKDLDEAEYLLYARFENRVVEAWLGVFGKPFVPKATLLEKTRALALGAADLASKYKPSELPGK